MADPVAALPPDLACRVLAWLDPASLRSAGQVCQAWHRLICNRAPWGSLTVPARAYGHPAVKPCCSQWLVSLLVHCPPGADVSDWLGDLLAQAPALESLELVGARRGVERLCQEKLNSCPSLRRLALTGSPCDLTDAGVLELTRRCPAMRHLTFHPTSRVTDRSLVAMATAWPGLRTLTLLNCYGVALSDGAGVRGLLDACRRLRRLHLAIGSGLKPQFFTSLGAACANDLLHLRLQLLDGDQSMDAWPELDGLDGLGACASLRSLTLVDCGRPGPNAFASLAFQLPQLMELRIKYEDAGGLCAGISDQLLAALADHCPLLTVLRLSSCRHITDAGLAKLGPDLRRLSLRGCRCGGGLLTVSGLTAALTKRCRRLARLSLGFGDDHGDRSDADAASGPTMNIVDDLLLGGAFVVQEDFCCLVDLRIDGCDALVSDAGLDAIVGGGGGGFRQLERLRLGGRSSGGVTADGLKRFAAGLPPRLRRAASVVRLDGRPVAELLS